MNRSRDPDYQQELKKIARRLGVTEHKNLESAIIGHCKAQLAQWISQQVTKPKTLTEALDLVGTSLGIQFEDVTQKSDIDNLINRYREPVLIELHNELDDTTDAILVRRLNNKDWELPFLAIINCQGWHAFRKYFSKWHEAAHRMIDGKQLSFVFRRTQIEVRREPEEILADKIAGELAFYSPMFQPIFINELEREGCLSFKVIDNTRDIIAPGASREATINAGLQHCTHPVWFLKCVVSYKKGELISLSNCQNTNLAPPEPRLRISESQFSTASTKTDIRFYKNMKVPETSIIYQAFQDNNHLVYTGQESLEDWKTSSRDSIGSGIINVEARRIEDDVCALVQLI